MKNACLNITSQMNRSRLDVRRLHRLYVNDKYKFIYCEVPKVACTNWKRIMLILTGKMNTTNPSDLKPSLVHTSYATSYLRTLNSYSSAEIQYRVRNYYKVMFVRDPLERILSAYKNKFKPGNNAYFNNNYGRHIIKQHRVNATKAALRDGNDVTFNEFLNYLVDPRSQQLDIHWQEFHKLCRPCSVQYDYIGKYETLEQDGNRILEKLNVYRWLRFPTKSRTGVKTTDILKTSFANVSSEMIHKLWQRYSKDYKMFGYDYPNIFLKKSS